VLDLGYSGTLNKRSAKWVLDKGLPLGLLHCVLNSPTPDSIASLGQIRGLKESFPDLLIGYSDHILPGDMSNLISATLLGARVIEKHFTHDKKLKGNDHYHSMEQWDLTVFFDKMAAVNTIVGGYQVTALSDEGISRKNARRTLVALVALVEAPKNTIINENMLLSKRPESGMPAYELDNVVGQVTKVNISKDEILQWNMVQS